MDYNIFLDDKNNFELYNNVTKNDSGSDYSKPIKKVLNVILIYFHSSVTLIPMFFFCPIKSYI